MFTTKPRDQAKVYKKEVIEFINQTYPDYKISSISVLYVGSIHTVKNAVVVFNDPESKQSQDLFYVEIFLRDTKTGDYILTYGRWSYEGKEETLYETLRKYMSTT